jgi:two-component system sensor histidine kinase/response regulator
MEIEKSPLNLPQLLREVIVIFNLTAKEKGIGIGLEIRPEVPDVVLGDSLRGRQVVVNLLNNAIKFTAGGTIRLTVRIYRDDQEGEWVHFSVKDTGIGIPPEKLSILFSKFDQVDVSTTREYGGTGLGLAISKQLVELMGGEIGVRSELGHGSGFWFTIGLDHRETTLPFEAERPVSTVLVSQDVYCRSCHRGASSAGRKT